MSPLDVLCTAELDQAQIEGRRRYLRSALLQPQGKILMDGKSLFNFSGNDYLGLAHHPALIKAARDWTAQYGVGAQGSRLICGHTTLHETIEAKIAQLSGTEAALLFNSGWQANAAVLPALLKLGAKPTALVFTDRLNHASLHYACQAAGVRQIRYRHNDLNHLEKLLRQHRQASQPCFIITESVFSMEGDQVDIFNLTNLAQRYGAAIYLDEAHAIGVTGPKGMGLANHVPGKVDIRMGTFSKALGSLGAYIAGSRGLCDYLINKSSGFIYTTALPPGVLGAIDAALDQVPMMNSQRKRLHFLADQLRATLNELGISTGASSSQIVPAMCGQEIDALNWSAKLESQSILAVAIRPPTVPMGTSRLRFTLSAVHQDAALAQLKFALQSLAKIE